MKALLIILAGLIGIIGLVFLGLMFAANRRRPKSTNKGYSKLEKELLKELFDLFDTELKEKIEFQLRYFEDKRKWRQYWEKSMSVELYGDNESPLLIENLYPRKDESKLATIRFKVDEIKYSIEFDNYDGRVWGWKIRPNPKSIMMNTSIEIINKKINTDPNSFAQPKFKKEKNNNETNLSGCINLIFEFSSAKELYQPIGAEFSNNYISRINAVLPQEYIEITQQTEGANFNEFIILGISEIRTTGLDDGNYYHLVEFDDGIITIKENDYEGKLFYCHYSGEIEELNTGFIESIKKRIQNTTP